MQSEFYYCYYFKYRILNDTVGLVVRQAGRQTDDIQNEYIRMNSKKKSLREKMIPHLSYIHLNQPPSAVGRTKCIWHDDGGDVDGDNDVTVKICVYTVACFINVSGIFNQINWLYRWWYITQRKDTVYAFCLLYAYTSKKISACENARLCPFAYYNMHCSEVWHLTAIKLTIVLC